MKKNVRHLLLVLITVVFLKPAFPQGELDSLLFNIKNFLDSAATLDIFNITDQQEIDYGNKIAAKFSEELTLTDVGLERIKQIGNSIVPFVERKIIKYNFYVIESQEINAFSMAGGHIWITSSLLNMVENDDELAFVIGHEIAHEDKKHNKKRVQLLVKAYEEGGETSEMLVMIVQTLATLPFSKYDEFEADEWGAFLSKRADFNLQGGITFFEKLSTKYNESGEKDFGYIFRTHPYTKERIQKLKDFIKRNS